MAKTAVLVILDVGVNQKVDNTVIFGAKPDGYIFDAVATAQLLKDLQDQFLLVGTELHNVLTNILVGHIPEHIQFRLIGPKDLALAR